MADIIVFSYLEAAFSKPFENPAKMELQKYPNLQTYYLRLKEEFVEAYNYDTL
jgi:hypothetical protein